MSNTYTWTCTSLDCYPKVNDLTNVVYSIKYTLTGSTQTSPAVTAQINDYCNVTYPGTSPFVPFELLTNDLVMGWVKDALGKDGVQAKENTIDGLIAQKINPPSVTPALPWA